MFVHFERKRAAAAAMMAVFLACPVFAAETVNVAGAALHEPTSISPLPLEPRYKRKQTLIVRHRSFYTRLRCDWLGCPGVIALGIGF